eukprot:UC1_evm1s1985
MGKSSTQHQPNAPANYTSFPELATPPGGYTNSPSARSGTDNTATNIVRLSTNFGAVWPPSEGYFVSVWVCVHHPVVPRSENMDMDEDSVGLFRVAPLGSTGQGGLRGLLKRNVGGSGGRGGYTSGGNGMSLGANDSLVALEGRIDSEGGFGLTGVYRSRNGAYRLSATFPNANVTRGAWHHLVIVHNLAGLSSSGGSVSDSGGVSSTGTSTLFVDGVSCGKRPLPYPTGEAAAKLQISFNVPPAGGGFFVPPWSMGNLHLVRGPTSAFDALSLYLAGPDRSRLPDDPRASARRGAVSTAIVEAWTAASTTKENSGWCNPFEAIDTAPTSTVLNERLLCFFRAADGCIFSHPATHNTSFGATGPNSETQLPLRISTPVARRRTFGPPRPAVGTDDTFGGSSNLNSNVSSDIAPRQMETRLRVDHVLSGVGGVSVLLYLLARTPPKESCQATSLRLLFRAAHASAVNMRDMYRVEGYRLVHHFLRSSRCVLGATLLETLFCALCASENVHGAPRTKDGSNNNLSMPLSLDETAIIRDHNVLEMLLDWRVWQRAPVAVWQQLAASMSALVDPALNRFSRLNAAEIRRAGMLKQLLFAWQEQRATYPGMVTLFFVRCVHLVLEQTVRDQTEDVRLLMSYAIASHPPP